MTTRTPEQQLRAILTAARVRVSNARNRRDQAQCDLTVAAAEYRAAQDALDDMNAMAPEPKPKPDGLTEDQRELLAQVTDKNRLRAPTWHGDGDCVLTIAVDADLWERARNA